MANRLPAGFDTLEPFVERFAIAGTAHRAQRRTDSSDAERRAFHAAAAPLAAQALDFLDQKPLEALDDAERTLMDLMLMFAHIALAVEVQGPDEARHAELRSYMRVTRSPAGAFG